MIIEIIGSGCKKCKTLFDLTREISNEIGNNAEVLYSTDINKLINMGIMSIPVLMVDNKPVLIGVLPDRQKLKQILTSL